MPWRSDPGSGPKSSSECRCEVNPSPSPEAPTPPPPGVSSIGSGDAVSCCIPPNALNDPRLFRCVLSSSRRAPWSASFSSSSSSASSSLASEATDPDSDSDSAAPQLALKPMPTPDMPHEDPRLPPERSWENHSSQRGVHLTENARPQRRVRKPVCAATRAVCRWGGRHPRLHWMTRSTRSASASCVPQSGG